MAYDTPQDYAKILAMTSSKEDCGCGGECDECKEECGCCPPGLVAVKDADGNHVSCLTPNDAEQYMLNTFTCKEGYVKYIVEGKFIGCILPEDYKILITP